jgi:hypothetical protein
MNTKIYVDNLVATTTVKKRTCWGPFPVSYLVTIRLVGTPHNER